MDEEELERISLRAYDALFGDEEELKEYIWCMAEYHGKGATSPAS